MIRHFNVYVVVSRLLVFSIKRRARCNRVLHGATVPAPDRVQGGGEACGEPDAQMANRRGEIRSRGWVVTFLLELVYMWEQWCVF